MDIVVPADGHVDKILVRAGESFAQGKQIVLLKQAT